MAFSTSDCHLTEMEQQERIASLIAGETGGTWPQDHPAAQLHDAAAYAQHLISMILFLDTIGTDDERYQAFERKEAGKEFIENSADRYKSARSTFWAVAKQALPVLKEQDEALHRKLMTEMMRLYHQDNCINPPELAEIIGETESSPSPLAVHTVEIADLHYQARYMQRLRDTLVCMEV